jgi:peptidoglycan/LPS O-acetylase OafA/YrhL
VTTSPSSIGNYRADIDGLRGIAVISVIIFHIDKAFLPGGFVGVDVFFVISGYLITRHIWQDLAKQRFSLVQFYCRRIKRIAPAMLVVVAITVVLAQILMMPDDAKAVARSAAWSLASLANVFFWLVQDTGYFAPSSAQLPLLHLWSLGVEEQFYLIWPLVAMVAYRARHHAWLVVALGVVTISSFLLGQMIFSSAPSLSYYMLPTRAGELLLGAAAAFTVESRLANRLPAAAVGPIALAGAAMLAVSFVFISEEMVFPGLLAVPSTLGAALVILTGHLKTTAVSRLLRSRILLAMGTVSYSAYLWHWPVLAFYRYGYGGVGLLAGVILLALTFVLAALSYWYVEQPCRRVENRPARICAAFAGASAAIFAISLAAVYLDKVMPQLLHSPYRNELAAIRKETTAPFSVRYVCQHQRLKPADAFDARCVVGGGSDPAARVLLWGDSNATHYLGVIGTIANKQGFKVRNLEIGSCPPILGPIGEFAVARRSADCTDSQAVSRLALEKAEVIIISASWNTYQEKSDRFLATFFGTVRALTAAGKKVILIGKLPEIASFDRLCRAKALSFPFLPCATATAPLSEAIRAVNGELRAFANATDNVSYFDALPYLCRNGVCSAALADGKSLYFDTSHLSMEGSWALGEEIYAAEGLPAAFNTFNLKSK